MPVYSLRKYLIKTQIIKKSFPDASKSNLLQWRLGYENLNEKSYAQCFPCIYEISHHRSLSPIVFLCAPLSADTKYIFRVYPAAQINYDKATGDSINLTTTKIGPFCFILQSQLCAFFSSDSFSHHWNSISIECLSQPVEKFISLIYSLR